MKLAGKTALVTGAGRGIGRGIAKRLAADGARVIINYSRSAAQAESLVDEIKAAGGDAFAIAGDVADLDAIATMFERIRERVSSIDILVNNAGRGSGGTPTLETSTVADFDGMFALNTRGLFFVSQAAVRMMPDGGRIVNLSSTGTQARVPGLSIYSGSKAAVEAFTRIWATELAGRLITVNSIMPGLIDTDLITDNMPAGTREAALRHSPMKRLGQPADIADVVAFLASDDARWISGQCIPVNGGA
jgi:3-oxoacyl-[acyl-carrier protein] reductase